ncbi:cupin domain-containing protein [Labrenzia sp. PHM005]|uniref:cupin domain-containing protein n=1 Tax=Labrenzia sp. PHM005 TaxID=2590016 RepID=UPI00113FD61E|nr:cupin domain-containing protein [Labrenzia sp. PHM005]QDG76274.1 cupin domain-containing protein [Labrenzia sp. PHM005]
MKQKSEKSDFETAKRLRVIRTAKGLSQRKLAKLSGVGSGTISLIESGATQPSVALLKKILGGIDVNLGFFFSFEMRDEEKVFFTKKDHRNLGTAGVAYRLIASERQNRKIQMLLEEYKPGTDSGRASLSHEGEECGVVISGHLKVTVDGRSQILGPGDAYYFDSRLPHRFQNTEGEPCKVVSACTPSTF